MLYEKKLAKLLVEYSLDVQPGKIVSINGDACAIPLIKCIYEEVMLRGAYPYTNISFEGQSYSFYKNATPEHLDYLSPIAICRAQNVNYAIHIDCDFNTKELSRVDPEKMARNSKSAKPIRDILQDRETAKDYKWVVCPYPCNAMAQDAEMSLEEYQAFVWEACGLNKEDPTAYWKMVSQQQEKYTNLLQGTNVLRIEGKGIHLTANVQGRKWINCNGTCNMPDGEIYTSPVEDSVNGIVEFDYPACYNGFEVEGVKLVIKDGIIIGSSAAKNEEFLKKMIAMDEGSDKIGEIAFGVNENIKSFSKSILFDEKIGGTMHIAIGASYPDAGGLNKSGLHWDIVKSMLGVEVFVDDRLIYTNQRFIV